MKFLIRLLILLLLPLVLLGLFYTWVVWRTPAPDSAALVRSSDRKLVWKGDRVRVRLHLNGDRVLTAPPAQVAEPYLIVTLVDHSGSMGQGSESPLEAAKMAASYFSRVVATAAQPVGAVAFESRAGVIHDISSDGKACAEAILGIPAGGGTDIAAALRTGHQLLRDARGSSDYAATRGLMVLLSDGKSDRDPALEAARQAKQDDVRIITIGLGTAIDEDLLRAVASTEADFHYTIDASALGDVYMNIAGEMSPVVGYTGLLRERYHFGAFTLEQPIAGFQTLVDENRGQFELRLPVVFAQRVELPYELEARKIGLFGLGLEPAELTFVPDPSRPDQQQRITSSLRPPLLVISPWLLLLLFLPALAFLIWRLLRALFEEKPVVVPPPVPQKRLAPPPPLEVPVPAALEPRVAQPCLFVGLGRAGGAVLQGVAELLSRDRYLSDDASPPFHLLHLDVREAEAAPADARFPVNRARLPPSLAAAVEPLRRPGRVPEHLAWLPRAEVREASGAELDLSLGARGRRWASRLALFTALETRDSGFEAPWEQAIEWLKESRTARIVLVGALESGTGGLLCDVAYLLHAAVPVELRATLPIYAIALADVPADHARAALNQRAFLEELDRFLVATRVPQPMVYVPTPGPGRAHLAGELRGSVYSGFFLLASPTDDPEQAGSLLFSKVAALGHTLTEQSLVSQLQRHLDGVRSDEQAYEARFLEGVIHSLSLHLVRFPVPELLGRLSARFVMEVLGQGRLVGVRLSADGTRLEVPPAPATSLEEAMDLWEEISAGVEHDLSGEPAAAYRLYRAFCRTAAGSEPTDLAAAVTRVLGRHRPPSADALREVLRGFGATWLGQFLNGRTDLAEDAAAGWRSERIAALHAALGRLSAFGGKALGHEGPESPAGPEVRGLINEIHRFHQAVHSQTVRWLEALVDAGCTGTPPPTGQIDKGLYRRANDRYDELGRQLEREASVPWQTVLRDDDGHPRWHEDRLYEESFRDFLEHERGFLLRWIWELEPAADQSEPELRLRVITDQDRCYEPTGESMAALMRHLEAVAQARSRALEDATILDRLRQDDGELDLRALAAVLAEKSEEDGLRFNRQYPGGNQARRRVLAMLPDVEPDEVRRFGERLQRIVPTEVELVAHRDPHSLRLLVVDSVIPVGAVQLRDWARRIDLGTTSVPFVFLPEQEGERQRRLIEDRLGVVPCPELHPLTRLLAAAPMPRADWAGLLAENSLELDYHDGRESVVLRGATGAEPVVDRREARSFVAALLNVSYGIYGRERARTILERWRQRPAGQRLDRLAEAIRRWRDLAEGDDDGAASRKVLEQVVLLLRLEEDVERRRQEDSRR